MMLLNTIRAILSEVRDRREKEKEKKVKDIIENEEVDKIIQKRFIDSCEKSEDK